MVKHKVRIRSDSELYDRQCDLEEIKTVFDKLGLRFFLIDGILLGTIREKNFIKWDWDVELAIFEEEIMPNTTALLNALFNSGFEIININPFSTFFKINIKKRGTKFSLVGLKKSRNTWRYRSKFRYPTKFFDNAKVISFLGTNYLAPYPHKEILDFIYGQWQTSLKSSKQSEYLNTGIYMPRYLTALIMIKHFVVSIDGYLLHLKMGLTSKLFPDKREYLFSNVMLKKGLSENCVFLEIGSSDGLEMSNAIEFTKGLIEGYLIEPSVENLEKSKKRIQRSAKKYNVNINYINKVVSGTNKNIDYYYSATNPNLSGIDSEPKDAERRHIKSTTIRNFLLKENISLTRHLVIKMDVEGAETEILKSSLDLFEKVSRVSILLEVHPSLYKGDEMKEILDALFATGFNATLVETAGVKAPDLFKKMRLTPVMTFGYRGLYENIDTRVASRISSSQILNITNIRPYFTKKIIRSILIEKTRN